MTGAPDTIQAASGRVARTRRSFRSRAAERAIEAAIRLSGISAIVFVLAIFFFIFREAAPVCHRDRVARGRHRSTSADGGTGT